MEVAQLRRCADFARHPRQHRERSLGTSVALIRAIPRRQSGELAAPGLCCETFDQPERDRGDPALERRPRSADVELAVDEHRPRGTDLTRERRIALGSAREVVGAHAPGAHSPQRSSWRLTCRSLLQLNPSGRPRPIRLTCQAARPGVARARSGPRVAWQAGASDFLCPQGRTAVEAANPNKKEDTGRRQDP